MQRPAPQADSSRVPVSHHAHRSAPHTHTRLGSEVGQAAGVPTANQAANAFCLQPTVVPGALDVSPSCRYGVIFLCIDCVYATLHATCGKVGRRSGLVTAGRRRA